MRKKFAAVSLAFIIGGLGVAAPASAITPVEANLVMGTCYPSWAPSVSRVNVRNKPSLTGKVIGSIKQTNGGYGPCLSVKKTAKDSRGITWIYTTYNGKTGWVSTKNLIR